MVIIITDNILLILVQFDCWQDKQKYVDIRLIFEIFVQKFLCLESTGDYLSIPIGQRRVTVPSGFPSLNEV